MFARVAGVFWGMLFKPFKHRYTCVDMSVHMCTYIYICV